MLVCLSVGSGDLAEGELAALGVDFPTVAMGRVRDTPLVRVDANEDAEIDGRVEEAARHGPFGLHMDDGGRGRTIALLTRYQRFLGRRNEASAGRRFDHVLRAHDSLFDRDLPLCRADYDHALDTWQWVLRLSPRASFELQAAALFHDVERLESEARARVEHRAASYQAFKDAHARRGAAIARAVLAEVGLDREALDRVAALIEGHERLAPDDAEGALLAEGDALSFFSLNSSGFLDYFGADHTRRKIAFTLGRLRPGTRGRIATIRFRADVARLVEDVVRAEGG